MERNPWCEGTRLLEVIRAAGFDVSSWNLYPEKGKAQVVVDLKVKHPNGKTDEGAQGND